MKDFSKSINEDIVGQIKILKNKLFIVGTAEYV